LDFLCVRLWLVCLEGLRFAVAGAGLLAGAGALAGAGLEAGAGD
jgi:hypothetical protein